MNKYCTGDRPYDLDHFLSDTNDLAWDVINHRDLDYPYSTEPIYPLKWYVCFGKAPEEFITALLNSQPVRIAQILVTNRDESVQDVIRVIENRLKGGRKNETDERKDC